MSIVKVDYSAILDISMILPVIAVVIFLILFRFSKINFILIPSLWFIGIITYSIASRYAEELLYSDSNYLSIKIILLIVLIEAILIPSMLLIVVKIEEYIMLAKKIRSAKRY